MFSSPRSLNLVPGAGGVEVEGGGRRGAGNLSELREDQVFDVKRKNTPLSVFEFCRSKPKSGLVRPLHAQAFNHPCSSSICTYSVNPVFCNFFPLIVRIQLKISCRIRLVCSQIQTHMALTHRNAAVCMRIRSRQVHASPARALVDPIVAGPRAHQAPVVRAVGLARGPSGSWGSRRGSLGAGEEGLHAVREVCISTGPRWWWWAWTVPVVVTNSTRRKDFVSCVPRTRTFRTPRVVGKAYNITALR